MRHLPLLVVSLATYASAGVFVAPWYCAVWLALASGVLWYVAIRLVDADHDASAAVSWRRTAMRAMDRADATTEELQLRAIRIRQLSTQNLALSRRVDTIVTRPS